MRPIERRPWALGALALAIVGLAVAVAVVLPERYIPQPGATQQRAERAKPPERRAARQTAGASRVPSAFSPTSFWNASLQAAAPLDPRSRSLVDELRRQVKAHGPWINTTRYSTPVYTVPKRQPTVEVALDVPVRSLQAALAAVPVPKDAVPAAGTDGHMVIRQPASDTMWEFFGMRKRADGWHAKWGGRMDKVSANPGHFEEPHPDWGATATSLPLLGGLITIEEARKGRIDHALAFALPQTRAGVHAWPAQRSDGVSRRPGAIPEGTRFRLDPELDVESLGLPALTRLMAEAAQRHGIVLRDQSGAVTFYGEDPTPTGQDPWSEPGGLFGCKGKGCAGQGAGDVLADFPWHRLQALASRRAPRADG